MPLSIRVAPMPVAAAGGVRLGPIAETLRDQLVVDPDLAAFYESRDWRPVWIQGWRLKPEARDLVQAVSAARDDGLDPGRYGASGLAETFGRAASGAPADLARAEIALSRAAADYLADLHTPRAGAEMVYAEPALKPRRLERAAILQALGGGRAPGPALAELRRMNPLYQQLHEALARWRAGGGDPAVERTLLTNLERARSLPVDLGRRYIVVDAAAQTLRLYEDDRLVDSMPVVVGKVSEPTPSMAGLVRYAVVRPYWNVPPDLVQARVAPMVLRHGPGYLAGQNMEALSGWTPDATVVPATAVNWKAVVSGRQILRVRQLPGPHNMMGQVKFIFPNRKGVYLHDSPLRQYFGQSRRAESAGCVRLADAPRLARWLLAERADALNQPGDPETRVDLDRPVPVYIVYFTAAPSAAGRGVDLRPDIYHRDQQLEARLAQAEASA